VTASPEFASEHERVLAGIWSRVLDTAPIRRDDHFFAIGGNSMSALRVSLAAEDEGLTLGVRDLFLNPVLADLAATVGPAVARAEPEPEPADGGRSYPALRMQVGMLFESERDPDRPAYHVVSETVVELLAEPTLTESLRRVVDAQPGLRTGFDLEDADGPQQIVRDLNELPLRVDDLSASSPAEADAVVERIRSDERGRPFDRDDFPLWRLRCVALPDGRMRLFMAHHHAVLDGWSVAVFVDQLLAAGHGRQVARPSDVCRAAAEAEAEALATPAAQEHWSAIVQRWRGLDVSTRDRAADEPAIHSVTWPIEGRARDDIERACARGRCSARQLFLAVHLRALEFAAASGGLPHGLSRGPSRGPAPGAVVVVNARPETPDAHLAVGVFLNAAPVLAPEPGASWPERVAHAAAQEAAMQQHRHFPFAAMRSRLGLPAPTTWFTFTDFGGTSLGGFLRSVTDYNVTELPLTVSVVDDGLVVDGSTEHFTRAYVAELVRLHVECLDAAVRAAAGEDSR
jgi:hypothetical protein